MEINTQQDALQLLVSAVRLAVKRGAFELEEVETISKAVKMFSPSKVEQVETAEVAK